MSLVQATRAAMTFSFGLWAGGVTMIAVERASVWREMPVQEYAVDFRRSLRFQDPMMPIVAALGTVSAATYATQTEGPSSTLAWTAAGLAGLGVAVSIALEGVNSRFRQEPEGTVPTRAAAYRRIWREVHRVRAALAVLAFGLVVAATTVHGGR